MLGVVITTKLYKGLLTNYKKKGHTANMSKV